jgi:peroxiredoxin Q/BCP
MTTATQTKDILKHKFETTDGTQSLSDYKGQNIVLYFYPKDNTSGCTQESKDFRDNLKKFTKCNTVILGISRDSLKSHDKFINDHDLNFTLISDPDETFCNMFDVMKEKSMYGRKYMGIERSTFLFDEKGKLVKEWRKLKVPGHVDEVLTAAKEL